MNEWLETIQVATPALIVAGILLLACLCVNVGRRS